VLETTVGGRHFLDLAKTAHIIEGVPKKVDYQYGRTFFTWAAMPIPRTLWKEKPTLGSGPMLGRPIFGVEYAGVPPGIIAELYMNFGILGIPIGMFLVGVLLKFIYSNFRPLLRNRNAILLYSVVIVPCSFTLLTTDFSKALVQVLREGITIMIALHFIGKRPVAIGKKA
jgi:hypothetical protein